LTFFKTFVDQLQFEQSLIFLSKSETARKQFLLHIWQMIYDF